MEEIRKRGRPKRETARTEEEIRKSKELMRESRKRYRDRQKAQEIVTEEMENNPKRVLREIEKTPEDDFQRLRPLALKALEEILEGDKPREKITAANMILSRTDPEKRAVAVQVTIHPIDLTPFKRVSCNAHSTNAKALPAPIIDCEFQDISPQISPQVSQSVAVLDRTSDG